MAIHEKKNRSEIDAEELRAILSRGDSSSIQDTCVCCSFCDYKGDLRRCSGCKEDSSFEVSLLLPEQGVRLETLIALKIADLYGIDDKGDDQ